MVATKDYRRGIMTAIKGFHNDKKNKKCNWRCICGKNGFIDVGENNKENNRYPCKECFLELRRK